MSNNVVDFLFAFRITIQQVLEPLWSHLLLCNHQPSPASFAVCFKSLLLSSLPTLEEYILESFVLCTSLLLVHTLSINLVWHTLLVALFPPA
jgi:hypothetical protein